MKTCIEFDIDCLFYRPLAAEAIYLYILLVITENLGLSIHISSPLKVDKKVKRSLLFAEASDSNDNVSSLIGVIFAGQRGGDKECADLTLSRKPWVNYR